MDMLLQSLLKNYTERSVARIEYSFRHSSVISTPTAPLRIWKVKRYLKLYVKQDQSPEEPMCSYTSQC